MSSSAKHVVVLLVLTMLLSCVGMARAEPCADFTQQLKSLYEQQGLLTCTSETYSGDTDKCISYHTKRLAALKGLDASHCPLVGTRIPWAEQISATEFLLAQMKKHPNGSVDVLDEMDRARQAEIDRLESGSKAEGR